MVTGSEFLIVDRADGVATVTLNRPEARNALSGALLSRVRSVMVELGADDEVRAVILTGADPAFCAGLDLKELSQGQRLLGAIDEDVPPGHPWQPPGKPLIAAVNGPAVTGGFELALNCDFIIASERATFADTHARVGILPGWGLSVLLPQRVGFAMARRMSFTGDYVDARQALQIGLVTEVVPHGELMSRVKEVAATIAANHRSAIQALHRSYSRVEKEAAGEGLRVEQESAGEWIRSGGTAGLADRVPGVFERGRSQVAKM